MFTCGSSTTKLAGNAISIVNRSMRWWEMTHFGGFLLGRKKRERESVMSGRVGRVIPP